MIKLNKNYLYVYVNEVDTIAQPKYMMIKEQIKNWISEGKINPGEKIYSESEMMDIFSVSRHTIRQAVGVLVHEGWLYREQGAGTFCSTRNVESNQSSLQTTRKNIGVITTYLSDYIFPSIIKGIESYLTENGYSLTLACTNNDVEKEQICLQTMLNNKVDGLIVEPTRSNQFNPNINYYLQLEQQNIPYLMINQYYPELNPPHITLDDEKGGYLATEHLISLGHERIIGLFKSDDLQGVNRMRGFMKAIRTTKLPSSPDMIISYTTEEKYNQLLKRLKDLFSSNSKPTAIVCYNDELAIQVINAVRALGQRVPEDVSVIGFDDSYLSVATDIQLTTIKHPQTEMGIDAAKWIISTIEQKGELPPSKIFEPELIVRESTAVLKN